MECIVCGTELVGRQTKYCSSKCKYLFHKPYYLEYQKNNRQKRRMPRFCIVCGKELHGRKYKYCSLKCSLKANQYDKYIYEQNRTLPIPTPNEDNLCEECGGEIIFDDYEYFCKKCGLVVV